MTENKLKNITQRLLLMLCAKKEEKIDPAFKSMTQSIKNKIFF